MSDPAGALTPAEHLVLRTLCAYGASTTHTIDVELGAQGFPRERALSNLRELAALGLVSAGADDWEITDAGRACVAEVAVRGRAS